MQEENTRVVVLFKVLGTVLVLGAMVFAVLGLLVATGQIEAAAIDWGFLVSSFGVVAILLTGAAAVYTVWKRQE